MSPVLPLARLPLIEYKQGDAQEVSDQELHPPCSGSLVSFSVVFGAQVPRLHHNPEPQFVPSNAG